MIKAEGVRKRWERYKYVAAVVLVGAVLLLWPTGEKNEAAAAPIAQTQTVRTERELEKKLEEILSTISGVGETRVLLTLESDGQQQLAQDTELSYSGDTSAPDDYSRRSETVVVDSGSGDGTVVTGRTYPTYRGALVVCRGGDRAEVQLSVTKAVAALTGLAAQEKPPFQRVCSIVDIADAGHVLCDQLQLKAVDAPIPGVGQFRVCHTGVKNAVAEDLIAGTIHGKPPKIVRI